MNDIWVPFFYACFLGTVLFMWLYLKVIER